MDEDSLQSTAKTGLKRRWQRRWATLCRDCGTPILFADNTQPAAPGKKWSPWVAIELYGERDGQLMAWTGEIGYSPKLHVAHAPNCIRTRRRLAWILRNKTGDDL